nr:smalltalk protein [uncultured Bacteroides sp.]
MKKQLWRNILQFIVTIATSVISALGVTSCTAGL